MWSLTNNSTTKRDHTGVTNIGLRSLTPPTGVHLGTGVITAVRHAAGTTPRPIDIFTSIVTTSDIHQHAIYPIGDIIITRRSLSNPSQNKLNSVPCIFNEMWRSKFF